MNARVLSLVEHHQQSTSSGPPFSAEQVQRLVALLRSLPDNDVDTAPLVWGFLAAHLLTPEHPLALHQELLAATYCNWPACTRGPHQVYVPSDEEVAATNVVRFLATFKGDAEFERSRGRGPASDWVALHALSCRDPELLLAAFLERELALPFVQRPSRMLHVAPGDPDACCWLPGARLNIAHCALASCRRRAAAAAAGGSGAVSSGGNFFKSGVLASSSSSSSGRAAILYAEEHSPEQVHVVTLGQLRQQAAHVAVCLRARGLAPGDAVAIVLPMTADAVAIYLGIVLAGCVVVSIADSFSSQEISTRLTISHAKLVFTQDVLIRGGKPLELYGRVRDACGTSAGHSPEGGGTAVTSSAAGVGAVVLPGDGQYGSGTLAVRLQAGDDSFRGFLALAPEPQVCETGVAPGDGGSWWGPSGAASSGPSSRPYHVASSSCPSNILFSSGTTGEPKAIVWSHAMPLRAALDGWAQQDIRPGSVVCWPTNMGWMMGPWLLYATLLNGGTLALYHGSPLGRDFGQFVAAAKVEVLGVVPSIVKTWRSSECMKGLRWPALRCFSSTGEASSPDDYHWLMSQHSYRPIIEYCGGTEIGGAFLSCSPLQPQSPSVFSTPTLGVRLMVLGEGDAGELALVPPILGSSQRLLNRDHAEVYYKGMPIDPASGMPLRRHGDEVQKLPGGYYRALGRCDDTMNLGGVKVSSVELERAVMEGLHDQVAEVAAVALPTPGGGPEQLVLVLVLRRQQGQAPPSLPALLAACQREVRSRLNPLFKVSAVHLRSDLPRTATNKVMRRVLRDELMAAPRAKM